MAGANKTLSLQAEQNIIFIST